MEPAQTFKDLVVWQKAHAVVLVVYKLTEAFPKHELYGLTSQMRRAAVSVPANIAESFKKRTDPEKARILNIAQGSHEEVRYFSILSEDLGYIEAVDKTVLDEKLDDVGRLLYRYASAMFR